MQIFNVKLKRINLNHSDTNFLLRLFTFYDLPQHKTNFLLHLTLP